MFFLQMSGVPGSGKSTLARAIATATAAIVIDHDIVKSALMESSTEELSTAAAGKIAYAIEWALIDFHLSQGQSVILDSPCLYAELLTKGTDLAQKHGATYKYVECSLQNIKEIDTRLRTRQALPSQNRQVISAADFRQAFDQSQRPTHHPYLTIDSGRPLHSYLDEVLTYLNT